ncbi:MAG: hypothetical protein KI790_00255 [Cyclobacteriaceae bacterium]|nr:hypothetical protein [Cyclobacteriaceae bacterium HetDA_MAG_MS6]
MRHYAGSVFMRKWLNLLSGSFLFLTLVSHGQNIPIGEWRTHFSYQTTRLIALSNSGLFCASENGLFFIDDQSSHISTLTKLDGLSEVGITAMVFDPSRESLIIGYGSGTIDILSPTQVISINTLKEADFGTEKTIQQLVVKSDLAYAATAFGVAVIDLNNQEAREVFREIGPFGSTLSVKEIELVGDSIFIISNNGIQLGNVNDNLLDFNNWQVVPGTNILNLRSLASHEGKLYTISNDFEILEYENGLLSSFQMLPTSLNTLSSGSELLAISDRQLYQVSSSGFQEVSVEFLKSGESVRQVGDVFWIADSRNGLIRKQGSLQQCILPNGPATDDISHIQFLEGEIFTFFGPKPTDFTGAVDSLGYSSFSNGTWNYTEIDGFYNISATAKLGNQRFFTSTGMGIWEVGAGLIDPLVADPDPKVFSDIISTGERLFASRFDSDLPIYQMSNGEWDSFGTTLIGTRFPVDIEISQGGVLWITQVASNGGGAIAYEPQQDDFNFISTTDELPSNSINDLVIDLNDEAWIATNSGVGYYPDATFAFENFVVIVPIFDDNFLFRDEDVTALAMDGGNRRWIGTNIGLWVFDESISTLVHHFTADNSPLPSDIILELAYDQTNGEVFVVTDKGVASYRSSSSQPIDSHENVTVFPNPVRPDFHGKVGITGVATNATIKITDINGVLVDKVEANGSTASWNLRDYTGGKVRSGVYLLFSTTSDGEETFVGKVAVVR